MFTKLLKLQSTVGQAVRSAQAFAALRQLQKGAHQGVALNENPALGRLARSMHISTQAARDVYMGTLRTDYQAAFIVDAHKTLQGAQRLARFAPSTGVQVGLMLKEVRSVHVAAVHETIKLSRDLMAANRRDTTSIRSAYAAGRPQLARALRQGRNFNVTQLAELTDELKILSDGLA